jgi:DNA-binding HxlR family transcriptional regulator
VRGCVLPRSSTARAPWLSSGLASTVPSSAKLTSPQSKAASHSAESSSPLWTSRRCSSLQSGQGELRKAEWAEFDLEHAEWRIPAAKMKMRRLHRVPLSRQALAIIRDLQAISRGGRWLFPSVRSISRPISENTLNAALRRLGYSKGEMIERQLAHQESDDVRRAYLHAAEYWPERVRMMQAWADYRDELRDAGKVVPLRRENA